jgi:PPIC-type peptidyl-prolyl cis-trans isomerase-like protein
MRIDTSRRPGGRAWHRLVLVTGFLGLAAAVCLWARSDFLPRAFAQLGSKARAKADDAAVSPEPVSDYSHRPVAYVNGNTAVTREQLGEWLIARLGAQNLELMVNRIIIDNACKEKNITVTAREVDEALAADIKGMGVNQTDFVSKVLKHYNKTLYEWKEDVIRPKLAMAKLCKSRVHVTDSDLHAAFDAYYGEQVDCQIILFPKEEESHAMSIYAQIRDDPKEFEKLATHQASPTLASTAGHIKPFGRHTTGNEELELAAFGLKPGEISRLVGTPQGIVVAKCIKRVPPDKTKKFAEERAKLEKEVIEKKVQQEIPVCFKELRDKARPNLILTQYVHEEDLMRSVRQTLGAEPPPGVPPGHMPLQGN